MHAGNSSSNSFKILGRSLQVDVTEAADTTLRHDSLASPLSNAKGIKRKWNLIDGSDPLLSSRLGHSSSSSDSKGSSATACTSLSSAKETEEASSMDIDLDFSLHLGNEKPAASNKKPANLKMKGLQVLSPKFDLELSLSGGGSYQSEITALQQQANQFQALADMLRASNEESTSCGWRPGFGLPTLPASSNKETSSFLGHVPKNVIIPAANVLELSSSTAPTTPVSSGTFTSGLTQQLKPQLKNSSSSKLCQVEGCQKGVRGASGRCISHGGGRRCQKHGCHKGAEGRTVYCKAHGGGRRCEFLGCTKSAEGHTGFCIAHGGGRRCSHEDCTRAARGRSGLCIRHGGGKRCQRENCTKSAEGLSGLCISHGGGRRCQSDGCTKGAQGSSMFCKAHGGGKRCTHSGCTKGAEGSTPFCKGHGGGPPDPDSDWSFAGENPSDQQLQIIGPRSSLLSVHEDSHKIKKRHHPKFIKASASDFCNVVKRLTGIDNSVSDVDNLVVASSSAYTDYDVVIRYRRGDVSNDNFIGHLRAALCRRGISVHEDFDEVDDAVPECRVLIIFLTTT